MEGAARHGGGSCELDGGALEFKNVGHRPNFWVTLCRARGRSPLQMEGAGARMRGAANPCLAAPSIELFSNPRAKFLGAKSIFVTLGAFFRMEGVGHLCVRMSYTQEDE